MNHPFKETELEEFRAGEGVIRNGVRAHVIAVPQKEITPGLVPIEYDEYDSGRIDVCASELMSAHER